MNVHIEVIPHSDQRYPTVGDWFFEGGELMIRVSDLGNWRYQMLVAVHELSEALMCKEHGVSQAAVDRFDKKFEKERVTGLRGPFDEPGDDSSAPYRKEHGIATGIERILAAELNVDWNKYADAIESLP